MLTSVDKSMSQVIAALAAALAFPPSAVADEVICDPLPTGAVSVEKISGRRGAEFHLYFPPTVGSLIVDAATVEFIVASRQDCDFCSTFHIATIYSGQRVIDEDIDVFEVAFRVPEGYVKSIHVTAAYSGACTTQMRVEIDPRKPASWPKPFQRSDYERGPDEAPPPP